jgi:hypothetical protein
MKRKVFFVSDCLAVWKNQCPDHHGEFGNFGATTFAWAKGLEAGMLFGAGGDVAHQLGSKSEGWAGGRQGGPAWQATGGTAWEATFADEEDEELEAKKAGGRQNGAAALGP